MGPISRIWLDLDDIRAGRSSGENLDPSAWLTVIEKTLLGQAFSTTTYHRRMNVLYNLTKDLKDAKKLLKTNAEDLSKGEKLFGKRFYKVLAKASKIRKSQEKFQSSWAPGGRKGEARTAISPQTRDLIPTNGPFSRGPHLGEVEVAAGSLSQEQEGTPQDLIEVSQCSAFISPNHSGTKSLPISPNIMEKVDVPVPPKMVLDQNLVYDAVKDLRLEPPKTDYPIGGRLQHFLSNWKLLTQDSFILRIVQGLEIPFLDTPIQAAFHSPKPNQKNATDRPGDARNAFKTSHQGSSCISRSISEPCLSSPEEGRGTETSNQPEETQYVEYQHFKLEGIQALKSLIKKGDYMVKLDLSDAYFGVSIIKSHRKFLRFQWKGRIYEFQALPFGLGVGPRYCTKLLKPVIAFLRRIGVRIIIYLDDMILLNQSSQLILRDLTSLRWLLENLGFLINWKKSV